MAVVHYRALPILKIDGEDASTDVMEDILQITVEESLHAPSMFTVVLRNDYQPGDENGRPWKHQDLLQMGKSITIGFSNSTTESDDFQDESKDEILDGEITAIETHFTEKTQAPIVIRGYDVSHRLHRGRYNRSFQNMTDSDIVRKIADEVGIKINTIDESEIPHKYLFQENQTNMSFLRERASRNGFELFIQDGKLNFRRPKSDETLQLKWLTDISSFRVRVTSTEQVKEVEVRGWDYMAKRSIVAIAQNENLITETDQTREEKGSDVSTVFNGKSLNPRMVVVDRPVSQSKEADVMAQALCNELGGQYVYADAKGEGNPNIRPGCVVELDGLGPYSGKHYVTETRHVYAERIYTTEFSVRGLRCGNLLTTLAPSTRPQPGQTCLVGIVTDNEDPDDLGRVKVKFPTLTEDHNSNWARVVSIGAGNDRGFDCLPEIDDEVLVAFEHGDIHRPYILGGVWNGTDAPPNSVSDNVQDGNVRLRTIKTRTGHQIQFIDEDSGSSETGVLVTTKGGHSLHLNDSANSISLNSSGSINITAAGEVVIKGAMILLN